MNFKERIEKFDKYLRTGIMAGLIVSSAFGGVIRLMQIQIVDSEDWTNAIVPSTETKIPAPAARGQIFDSSGKVINTNHSSYKLIVAYMFFPKEEKERSDVIAGILEILKDSGEEWNDNTPISKTAPYYFLPTATDTEIENFKKRLELNPEATVENCIAAMYKNFDISDDYDEKTKREIAGVRYEMIRKDFSQKYNFIFSDNISLNTVLKIKERSSILPGADIMETTDRIYLNGELAPHTRGTISKVFAEEYEELKDKGYERDDVIGRSGIEKAYEDILRGQNGTIIIEQGPNGEILSNDYEIEPIAGNSIRLTIESKFQKDIQDVLANGISWLRTSRKTMGGSVTETRYRGIENTEGGSIVVLDAKTGGVLAMASYPNYDINDYLENYQEVLNAELQPLFSRATEGIYRPGSTFKTITGTAGMIYGEIGAGSVVNCGKYYRYYTDYQPQCTGYHGGQTVITGLKNSCNVFFYDVGRRVGLDNFAAVANMFGLGTDVGLELYTNPGRVTTVDYINKYTENVWNAGDTLQAAIGQMETYATPLQLAVQAMTFANDGVRFQPHVVDSVWNYEGTQKLYDIETNVAEVVTHPDTGETVDPYVWNTIRQGMIQVSTAATWPIGGGKNIFTGLPELPALKTGSPQVHASKYNSTVIGYYPPSDPEIAFAVVLENSDFSRYFIRNIIDAYYGEYEPYWNDDKTLIISPWKEHKTGVGNPEDSTILSSSNSEVSQTPSTAQNTANPALPQNSSSASASSPPSSSITTGEPPIPETSPEETETTSE